jgi:hypothetical protein
MIIIKQKEDNDEIKNREEEREKNIYMYKSTEEREGRFISFVLYEDEKKQTLYCNRFSSIYWYH